MIRINLLPHREMRRERRKKDFIGLVALVGIAAVAAAIMVGFGINQQISAQTDRNEFIKSANAKLDEQIKEIATLRREIESLKARQAAVENLQSDRTTPVHLLDELVKHTPEGIFLKQIKQEERKLTLFGYAQSNERVSELLRNLSNNTAWVERPDLVEIKAVTLGAPNQKDGRTVYEFSMNAAVRTPSATAAAAAAARKTTSAPASPLAATTAAPGQ